MRTRTTVAPPPAPSPVVTYRAAKLPSGRLMPIEVRIGRRLLRTIPAESNEGRRLLGSNRVEIIAVKSPPPRRSSVVAETVGAGGATTVVVTKRAPARPGGRTSRDH